MNEGRKIRTIQIPKWMDTAVSELAIKHNRKVEKEIEFLVKAALEREAKAGNRPDSIVFLAGTGPAMGEKS
jgi:hypothetical protein